MCSAFVWRDAWDEGAWGLFMLCCGLRSLFRLEERLKLWCALGCS